MTVIVFGLNQTAIGAGSLATVPLTIAAGTAAGSLNMVMSGAVYSDAAGAPLTGGASANGTITVTAPPPPTNVVTSITLTPSAASIASNGTQQFTASVKDQFGATMSGVVLTWASSNASAASINASGLATGANVGASVLTSNITASASGVTSNAAVLTVSAPPAVVNPTLTAGTASGQSGTTVNLPITFNTGNKSVAGLQFNLTLPAGLTAGTVAAGSVVTAAGKSITANLSGNTLTVIVFGLNQTAIGSGSLATIPVTIAAGTAAGSLNMLMSGAVYSDAAGLPITGGASTNGTVTVTAPATPVLTSIAVAPTAATIAAAGTQQFTATAKDQFGATMSGIALTWASSNGSAATISASGLATGRNTGASALTANITASASGVTSNAAVLTVNAPIVTPPPSAPTLAAGTVTGQSGTTVNLPITFNPSTASVASLQFNLTVPAGLTAGTVAAGSVVTAAGKSITANLSGNVLTVIVFGLNQTAIGAGSLATVPLTIAAGTAAGNLSLPVSGAVFSNAAGTAIAGGTNTNGTVTVTAPAGTPVLTSITLTPSAASIVSNGTQQFTASVKDQFGATMSGVVLTWASSNASAASINASGLATGANVGASVLTSNITASASGVTSNAVVLTVSAPPAVAKPTLAAGSVTGQSGTTVNLPITFNPSTASVASLQFNLTLPAGLTAGTVAAGPIVTAAGKSITANLSGNVLTVIVFGLNQTAIGAGSLATVPLTIAAGTAAGNLSLPVSGAVFSNAAGTAIAGGTNTNGTVTVTAPAGTPVLTSIAVAPTAATIAAAGTQQFTATARDQFGATMSGIALTWASSNASAATISASGLATGRNTGASSLTSNITASASGVTSNAAVLTVSAAGTTPPSLTAGTASGQSGTTVNVPIAFNPGSASVAGLQFNLTLPAGLSAGTIAAGSVVTAAGKSITSNISGNVLTVIVFGLNQTAIGAGTLATVPLTIAAGTAAGNLNLLMTGAVYANAAGAAIAGTSANGTVTVTAPTATPVLTSIAITPSAATIAANGAQQFSGVARDQFGANMSGVILSWATNNTAAAVVSASGMATGRNTGSNALTAIITASASGITSNQATLTVNGTGVTPPPPPAAGSPTLAGGTVSGQAGTIVSLPITFDPSTASVSGMQFNLTLPASLSTGTVIMGATLVTSGKNVSANRSGNTWTFIVFGLNQTAIGSGVLLNAELKIAAGTAVGPLNLPITGVVYTNPAGNAVAGGPNVNATVNVVPAGADVTAPIVSNVSIPRATTWATSATVNWTTNEPADSQVAYGLTSALGTLSPLKAAMVTSHSVIITGLVPSTQYFLQVRSKDAAGNTGVYPLMTIGVAASNLAESGLLSFRTKGFRAKLNMTKTPAGAFALKNGVSALASTSSESEGGFTGAMLTSNVEVEEGLEPFTNVKMLHSDISGSTYTHTVVMTSTDSINFTGFINSTLYKGAGKMKFMVAVDDARGVADQTDNYDISITKTLKVDSDNGYFKVPDMDLSVRIAPKANVGEVQFTALDASDISLRARSEREIDFRYGDQPVAPVDIKVPGQSATVFNQPVTLVAAYTDVDGLDKNGDGIPDGDGFVDGTSIPELDLKLYTNDGLQWRMIGGRVDPVKNTVTGTVNHFTNFALFPTNASVAASMAGLALEKFLTPTLVDGINDVATFGITAENVTIYDVMGRKVYSASQSNSSAIIWNCRDELGRIVESGVYIAKIKQADGSTVYQSFAVAK